MFDSECTFDNDAVRSSFFYVLNGSRVVLYVNGHKPLMCSNAVEPDSMRIYLGNRRCSAQTAQSHQAEAAFIREQCALNEVDVVMTLLDGLSTLVNGQALHLVSFSKLFVQVLQNVNLELPISDPTSRVKFLAQFFQSALDKNPEARSLVTGGRNVFYDRTTLYRYDCSLFSKQNRDAMIMEIYKMVPESKLQFANSMTSIVKDVFDLLRILHHKAENAEEARIVDTSDVADPDLPLNDILERLIESFDVENCVIDHQSAASLKNVQRTMSTFRQAFTDHPGLRLDVLYFAAEYEDSTSRPASVSAFNHYVNRIRNGMQYDVYQNWAGRINRPMTIVPYGAELTEAQTNELRGCFEE